MADEPKKYTHVAVAVQTQRKISILAKTLDTNIYSLVEYWANDEWQNALKSKLVTKAMLEEKNTSKSLPKRKGDKSTQQVAS